MFNSRVSLLVILAFSLKFAFLYFKALFVIFPINRYYKIQFNLEFKKLFTIQRKFPPPLFVNFPYFKRETHASLLIIIIMHFSICLIFHRKFYNTSIQNNCSWVHGIRILFITIQKQLRMFSIVLIIWCLFFLVSSVTIEIFSF